MAEKRENSGEERECPGCKIIQDGKGPTGGPVILLKSDWTLNQYGGPEGFLGWLILQPREHLDWGKLGSNVANALGGYLKEIEKVLKDYWFKRFRADPIGRVYVVSFSEYSHGHLHFHIIPRTNDMEDLLYFKDGIVAWDICKVSQRKRFPPAYLVTAGQYNANVEDLMKYLEEELMRAGHVEIRNRQNHLATS